MRWLARIAVLFNLALLAQAQQQPQVAGRVVDKTTGDGIAGANITLYTSQAERYRAVTDDSGAFQLRGIDRGEYEVAVEKSGFVLFARESLQIGDGTATPTYELVFSEDPKTTLRGSILDSQGKPLANAPVDLIRGPSLVYRKLTDAEGRFSFDKLGAGSYKLRAAPPPNHPGFEVTTYFPGWVDESAARRFELQGGDAQVNGFRLATGRGVHLRGVVRDENSRPVANAIVQLLPIQQQPAHVVASVDSTFLAIPEGSGPGPAEGELRTDANGVFDFPAVRIGGWQIAARSQNLSGSVPVSMANEDVEIEVRIKEGPAYPAWFESIALPPYSGERPGKIHGSVINNLNGAAVAIVFESQGHIWGKLVACHLDGTFDIDSIEAGEYRIAAFRTMDMERMRDPSVLDKILSSRTKVRVMDGATTEVRLSETF